MKRLASLAVLGFCVGPAAAQSNITLYGVVNVGINYVSNLKSGNGDHLVSMQDGSPQSSRWGMRGTEDLGAGNRAFFTLEGGFAPDTGVLGQGGRLFGRQSFVGLSNDTLGTVTLGRQLDFSSLYVGPTTANNSFGGSYFSHMFDSDNTNNNTRISNALKYLSPTFGGVSFGGMYGSSDQAGGFKNNRAWSVGTGYSAGPLTLGAVLQEYDYPGANTDGAVSSITDATFIGKRQRIFGFGAGYSFQSVKVGANWTRTNLTSIASGPIVADSLRLDNYEINAKYDFAGNMFIGGGYTFTNGEQANGATRTQPRWHQFNLMFDYVFSKRTDVYLLGVYQRAVGDATFAFIYSNGSTTVQAPGSAKQTVARIGIRHRF